MESISIIHHIISSQKLPVMALINALQLIHNSAPLVCLLVPQVLISRNLRILQNECCCRENRALICPTHVEVVDSVGFCSPKCTRSAYQRSHVGIIQTTWKAGSEVLTIWSTRQTFLTLPVLYYGHKIYDRGTKPCIVFMSGIRTRRSVTKSAHL